MKRYHLIFALISMSFVCAPAQTISGGYNHSLFLCTTSNAMATGMNNRGQLGIGSILKDSIPVQVNNLSSIVAVTAGKLHSFFRKSDNTVWGCGYNYNGQLGDGTTTNKDTVIQVPFLSGITRISGGWGHSLFLKNDSTVWACGDNTFGELGTGTVASTGCQCDSVPVQVNNVSSIVAVSAGSQHSLFVKKDGTVWACGLNYYGALGNGISTGSAPNPNVSQVSSLTNVIAAAGGDDFSLFLKSDGTVWACGSNTTGELGSGTPGAPESTPVQVNGLSNIIAIAAGGEHSLFLKNDGTVWACGSNAYGELGLGTSDFSAHVTVTQIPALSNIVSIAAGGNVGNTGHSIFLKNDGTVWACGSNIYGGLGDGTTIERHSPVQVTGICSVLNGIEENNTENNFSVYPNPSTGRVYLSGFQVSEKNTGIEVMDITGKMVYKQQHSISNGIVELNLQLMDGVYMVRIINNNDSRIHKIIIQK